MHELSIAMSIVEIAEENVKQSNVTTVSEIELEVGELSGVVFEALEFAMEEAVRDTVLKDAIRKIIRIPGVAKCNECGFEFGTEDIYTPCPKCASFDSEVIKGKELRVKSLIAE
jgi:hydrogenase nickel incorporation protein HypA/HybF